MNRLLLVLAFGAIIAAAQPQGFGQAPDPGQAGGQDDPPSRVARLNWLAGDVAFQPATVDAWTNATVNYPLTTGDHLYVNPGGRAELHVDGSAIHLNSTTNFGFVNLDDSIVQMSLNEGSIEIRLRQLDQNDTWEIDTPNGAVTLLRAGEYRVDSDLSGNATTVTVITGQAEMYQEGNSLLITAHQSASFRGNGGPQVTPENPRDDFDAFVLARENSEDSLPRRDYVPDSMIGSDDLYAYGRWTSDPLYGQVWLPPVDPGWTPYSAGRWAFVEPWGWTWIDDEPWGFAPFHYGRWAMVRGGWAWIPGERTYRPVYAPALVGFIGVGGIGVSVGWFPLGPHEPWVPGWGASRAYVNRVNVMHVTNINVVNVTNISYVNRERVTVVSQADFAGARPVRASAIQVAPGQIRDARMIGYSPKIAPVRTSVVVGAVHMAPPVPVRVVVAHTAPPPPPVSFQARQQLLVQNAGQPLRRDQVEQLRSQQPTAVVTRPEVRPIGGMRNARPAPPSAQQPTQPGLRSGREGRPAVNAAQPTSPANTAPVTPNPGNVNRVPDRMNSRPPGSQRLPGVENQAQPAQPQQTPAPSRPPADVRPAPAPAQESRPAAPQMRPVPESRPAQPSQQPEQPRPAERRVERPAPQAEKPAEPAKAPPRKRPEQPEQKQQ